jgi:predicted transcriptional regulator
MVPSKKPTPIRLSLDMSPEANQLLEQLATANGTTKSNVMRRALTLFHLSSDAKSQGKRVCILDQRGEVITEIVGL